MRPLVSTCARSPGTAAAGESAAFGEQLPSRTRLPRRTSVRIDGARVEVITVLLLAKSARYMACVAGKNSTARCGGSDHYTGNAGLERIQRHQPLRPYIGKADCGLPQ